MKLHVKVSLMILVVIIIFVLTIGYLYWQNQRIKIGTIKTPPILTLPVTDILNSPPQKQKNQEGLPGLYPSVQWEATKPGEIILSRKTPSGGVETIKLNTYRTESVILKDPPYTDFIRYYNQKLSASGWKEYSAAAASGPTGEQRGYEKEGRYFLLGFGIMYSGGRQQGSRLGTRLFVEHN